MSVLQKTLPRVLIVDDESEIVEVLTEHLKLSGIEDVTSCKNGIDAQVFLADARFDAIILDFKLPGRNGLQLLGTIASDPKNSHAKRYFMTGFLDDKVRAEVNLFRVDRIFEKPLQFSQIAAIIRSDLKLDDRVSNSHQLTTDCFKETVMTHFLTLDPDFKLSGGAVNRSVMINDHFRCLIPIFGSKIYGSIAISIAKTGLLKHITKNSDLNGNLDSELCFDVARELCNQIAGGFKLKIIEKGLEHVNIGIPYADRLSQLPHPTVGRVFSFSCEFVGSPMFAEICLGDL